jgi:polyisoprenoid-binding protein YceI
MYTARFDRESGDLNFDAQHPENSTLSISVDVASLSTGDVNRAGQSGVFDREIAAALGVEAHPQIAFVSTSIERTGDVTGLVRAALTLNGVTRPITLETIFTGGRRFEDRSLSILAFSARTTISRAEFGVTLMGRVCG